MAFAFKSSLLSLFTSHRAAGSRDICIAKVKEDRQMSRLIPGAKAKRRNCQFYSSHANPHAIHMDAWA